MASPLITKLISASNPLIKARSVVLNRPAAAVSCRLFSAKGIQRDGSGECIFKFKNDGSYTSDVPDVFKTYFIYRSLYGQHDSSNAVCPRLSAIRNMNRLLQLMDLRVGYGPCDFSGWEVMEDAEALYLVRIISSYIPKKDVDKLVYNSPTGLTTVYGTSLRVSRKTLVSRSIELTVGRWDGYHRNGFYPAYTAKVCLPASLFMVSGIKMDVVRKSLKITIPKVEGKWIRSITVQINLHSTIDDPVYYEYDP